MAHVGLFYDKLVPFVLTDAQLFENEYPIWLEEGHEVTVELNDYSKRKQPIADDDDPQRICERCQLAFDIFNNAASACIHHPKRPMRKRGDTERRYLCCDSPVGSAGCTTLGYHVTHQFTASSLLQYVQAPAAATAKDPRSKSVYALDAEFVYTSGGSEIARLTVVDFDAVVKLDALIRPANAVVDYNTFWSGLDQSALDNAKYTLETAREALFQFVNMDTILIGHGLERSEGSSSCAQERRRHVDCIPARVAR